VLREALAERSAALTSHDRSAEASRYRVLKTALKPSRYESRSRDRACNAKVSAERHCFSS
jgi:hypothetical protein